MVFQCVLFTSFKDYLGNANYEICFCFVFLVEKRGRKSRFSRFYDFKSRFFSQALHQSQFMDPSAPSLIVRDAFAFLLSTYFNII